MMRSLFAGVSGLRNHQTRMDVIGNNIANVNTTGFKASRVTFQDILSQTVQSASSGQDARGGTNPVQVGLGMGLASIDTLFTDGSYQPTGKSTDLAIQGSGFFILQDGDDQVYTRAGGFDFDNKGNFIVPGTGYKVMGWKADATGKIDTSSASVPITIPVGATMPAKVTENVTYSNNLSAKAAADATSKRTVIIDVYDSQGNGYVLNGAFQKTADNTWEFTPTSVTDLAGNVIGNVVGMPDPASTTTPPATLTTVSTINFDISTYDASTSVINKFQIVPTGSYAGAGPFTITPDFHTMTQYGGDSTAQADSDGYEEGTLGNPTIDSSGIISGKFSNGQSMALGKIALATFNNPSGLNKLGDNLYTQSNNSGRVRVGQAGDLGMGSLNPGSLEMSNVDLAQEFSNMIITQRGFQANSKIITVSDEMLEQLANLKR